MIRMPNPLLRLRQVFSSRRRPGIVEGDPLANEYLMSGLRHYGTAFLDDTLNDQDVAIEFQKMWSDLTVAAMLIVPKDRERYLEEAHRLVVEYWGTCHEAVAERGMNVTLSRLDIWKKSEMQVERGMGQGVLEYHNVFKPIEKGVMTEPEEIKSVARSLKKIAKDSDRLFGEGYVIEFREPEVSRKFI